jgi:iron complex transport system substrate-binding protein
MTILTSVSATTDTLHLDSLAHRAPATDDHGAAHLSTIERIELAERLITRRRFLIGAGALVLSACGVPGEQATEPTATVATTRTVTDHLGRTVNIPANPQRIVALDNNRMIVHLVELGLPVVGATTNGGILAPTLGDMRDQIASVGEVNEPSIETITALQPDLIMHNTYYEPSIGMLEQIAPVVGFDYEQLPTFKLFETIRWLGNIFNLEVRAQQLEDEGRQDFADAGAQLGLAGKRVAPVSLGGAPDNNLEFFGPDYAIGEFVQLLGATLTPKRVNGQRVKDFSEAVSVELAPDLLADTDFVIGLRYGGPEEFVNSQSAFITSAVWQAIPAVGRGDVAYLDIQQVSNNYGLKGLRLALDELEAQLQK